MNKQELIEILADDKNNKNLFYKANDVRNKYVGEKTIYRALIEFSNVCKRQCQYCGLQVTNKKINRYRILKDEILSISQIAIKQNYKTIVLQSGEDDFYDVDKMCEIIKEIKKYDVALTLSIGEKTYDEYKAYKNAGADRYLLKVETTDDKLYKSLHPYMSLENRKRCLYDLKRLGYEVGTGNIVGLPNQSIESLAEDILFLKKINVDMVGIGPFIPHKETSLGKFKSGSFNFALKVVALTRLILPKSNIPATTAMSAINSNGQLIALSCGANVIMKNVTPIKYRDKFEIYQTKEKYYE